MHEVIKRMQKEFPLPSNPYSFFLKINYEKSTRDSLSAKRNGIYVNIPPGAMAMAPGNEFIIHANIVKIP